ncbi:uncharacterized protein BCR38DRAFT_424579 [Pseudomassariella vexata]|uniref:Uncharacterized protein n=1 Tax=Pseudomassariella vexata TaxID=1141098 RepID=A0A1Y2EBD1_9PEZI|nr:uncharacterized protein BCR38DRAFT_424579 [Pseudomassariella vexata]ORY68883.1 hypothetical protein BCR38DRAFT_424579 [Pseudomassariella vexata]
MTFLMSFNPILVSTWLSALCSLGFGRRILIGSYRSINTSTHSGSNKRNSTVIGSFDNGSKYYRRMKYKLPAVLIAAITL